VCITGFFEESFKESVEYAGTNTTLSSYRIGESNEIKTKEKRFQISILITAKKKR